MSEAEQPRRRWHDERGELSEAIELLEFIPEPLIPLIADGLTMKADRDFQAGEILKSLRSLGSQKILSMHKSKQKRRSYDQHPDLSRIVNYFYILPEENQDQLANQFVAFTALIVDYMANCDTFDIEPNEDELTNMRAIFVNEGANAVYTYLSEIHQEFVDIAEKDLRPEQPAETSAPTPGAEKRETIVADEGGMKIRKI